jgi:hypothetical protein
MAVSWRRACRWSWRRSGRCEGWGGLKVGWGR